jgi:murein DD-endopeptidase MepM/ murein hydrolase activator NlpD
MRRSRTHRLPVLLLVLPLVVGLLGAPASTPTVRGDELADAKAQQQKLKDEVAAQKARVAALDSLQTALSSEIASTKAQLSQIGADLSAVKAKIVAMEVRIKEVQAVYTDLLAQLQAMGARLQVLEAQQAVKRRELTERRALLANRVRDAYDTDRTSPLETFISGGTFTDLLAEMSYYIDVAEQDKALASQITADKETLAAVEATVDSTKETTDELRRETAAQKRALDRSLKELEETRAALKALEKKVAAALAEQKRQYAALQANEANAARIIAQASAKQKELAREIDALIAKQVQQGNIPSEFNGTFRWPMDNFTISGNFGCSTFKGYAPGNGCAHFHNGIDLVGNPSNAPIRAAGDGIVVVCDWNWADGADPAWIVVIAHSSGLRTWYAHMQPGCPARVGESVDKGDTIGRQGNTGNSTGAHLHWMVEWNSRFVNPRLFL